MIRLQISPAAMRAIIATLPDNIGFEVQRAENGDHFVWLAADVVNKLKALRGLDQSLSGVILSLAKGEGGAEQAPNLSAQKGPSEAAPSGGMWAAPGTMPASPMCDTAIGDRPAPRKKAPRREGWREASWKAISTGGKIFAELATMANPHKCGGQQPSFVRGQPSGYGRGDVPLIGGLFMTTNGIWPVRLRNMIPSAAFARTSYLLQRKESFDEDCPDSG
jgi:hypothetical protein